MPNYYILWTKDAIDQNAICIPLLLPNSHTITQHEPTGFSDANVACGLAHEIWKPSKMLEAPKDTLVALYTKLVTETFEDTLEESFIAISEDCRGDYGYNCSLHQLFSGVEICPSSIKIKKNLVADIVNVVQDGLFSELKPAAQARLLSELRNVSTFLPPSSFQGDRRVGPLVAQLYALSFAHAGEAERAITLADETARAFGLSVSDRGRIVSLGTSVDALMGLHELSNSLVSGRDSQPSDQLQSRSEGTLQPLPLPIVFPHITPVGPPVKDEERFAYVDQVAQRLVEYDRKVKQARGAQIIVWSISLLVTLSCGIALLYPFDHGILKGGIDGQAVMVIAPITLICTFLIGSIPSLICNAILYPKGRRPLW